MTEHRPDTARRDYLPAAGRDIFLPGYDLLTRLMGMKSAYEKLLGQADLGDGLRVLEIGCGTGNVTVHAKKIHPGAELIGLDPDPRALARETQGAGPEGVFGSNTATLSDCHSPQESSIVSCRR